MIAFHLARLKDKNPEVRIKSIQELVLLEAVEAYEALEILFRTDSDVNVRKAAQQAGRALYPKVKAQHDETNDS
jgi:hypothetical protein